MKKYYIVENPRPSIDDVQFLHIIAITDPDNNEIEEARTKLRFKGGDLLGPYESEGKIKQVQENWRIESFKEYTKHVEAALVRGTRRPFLVKLDNKPGSDLLVYPGYYGIQQKSYAKLQQIFAVQLITRPPCEVAQVFQTICVRDLELLRQIGLESVWAFKYHPTIDIDPYIVNKQIFNKLLIWEIVCGKTIKLVVANKNPNFRHYVEPLEDIKKYADQVGFKADNVDLLIKFYTDNINDIPDEIIVPYGPMPGINLTTNTGEQVTIELL
jgi:hypothetical protein